jgi:NADPH:quinone reductase-like Zn-dependent oxidoreductase
MCGTPTFRTYLLSNADNILKIPDSMSLAEAASIPINFVTAFYCLRRTANLQPSETILIHLRAGGTGKAAIQVAQNTGATVFTTVGSERNKHFLISNYGIPENTPSILAIHPSLMLSCGRPTAMEST